jgi:hypothetical protein
MDCPNKSGNGKKGKWRLPSVRLGRRARFEEVCNRLEKIIHRDGLGDLKA